MNNTELRGLHKVFVIGYFNFACERDFSSEVTLKILYLDFVKYCESCKFQVISKKMFSILLREYLLADIVNGSIEIKLSPKNLYKGIGLRSDPIEI